MARELIPTALRWSDMDSFGHVNNVQFLRLLEEARILALTTRRGADGQAVVPAMLLVARAEIEYLMPLIYRVDPVNIDIWVSRVSGASFDLAYEVYDVTAPAKSSMPGAKEHTPSLAPEAGQRVVYARAETTMVVFDPGSGRPRKITDEERVRLEEWSDTPVEWRRKSS